MSVMSNMLVHRKWLPREGISHSTLFKCKLNILCGRFQRRLIARIHLQDSLEPRSHPTVVPTSWLHEPGKESSRRP